MSCRSLRRTHFLFVALLTTVASAVFAQSGYDIYRFPKGGHRGFNPQAGLVSDTAGNLYGTTLYGGTGTCTNPYTKAEIGCGTVFRLTPPIGQNTAWTQTVLYNFQGGADSAYPLGGVIFDKAGNLYGTTVEGGTNGGGGTVYELTPTSSGDWKETILMSFTADFGSSNPAGNLTFDSNGNLFGTTGLLASLSLNCTTNIGCLSFFELSPAGDGIWTGGFLPSTALNEDGEGPTGGLFIDNHGNLFGIANAGGTGGTGESNCCGTIFELSPPASPGGQWSAGLLHTFESETSDGITPNGTLISDKQRNLYGTTQFGGMGGNCEGLGIDFWCGTVFELSPITGGGWTETILYSFQGGSDGAIPSGTLIADEQGNLYGTTASGGSGNCLFVNTSGCGTVFKLTRPSNGGAWSKTTLYSFTGGTGYFSVGQLILSNGALFGTTVGGGEKCPFGFIRYAEPTCGNVFKVALH